MEIQTWEPLVHQGRRRGLGEKKLVARRARELLKGMGGHVMARGLRPMRGLLSWHASAATGGGLSFSRIGDRIFSFLGAARDR